MFRYSPHSSNLFSFRPLTAEDTECYISLRQNILKSKDAQFYCDSYERERQLTPSQWREWCAEKAEHVIIGAFAERELIGVMMITQQEGIHSPLVEWEAVWLHPKYRGQGLGKELFKAGYNWTKSQNYKYVVVFIRDTRTHCLDICKQMGFEYLYTVENEFWADGSVGNLNTYVLDLQAERKKRPTKSYIDEVLPYLQQGSHSPQSNDIGNSKIA